MQKNILILSLAALLACAHEEVAQTPTERDWEKGLDAARGPQIAPVGPIDTDQGAYNYVRRREQEHDLGSRMTAEPTAMAWLMADLQRRHKFFIDSRTSAKTVAAAQAQRIGLASLSRDVFLDDERTETAIAAQLETAIKLAHKQGSVVIIGHPYPQTLAVLERELPLLKARGVEWIDVKSMIALRGNRAMAAHGKEGKYQ